MNNKERLVPAKVFRRNKRKLIQLERDNYDKLIFVERAGMKGKDNDWREIAEHSALLYYYEICEPLGEQVNFKNDIDSYYDKYETGLICMNGLTKVRMLAKKAGLYAREGEMGEYYVIWLNKKFDERHFRTLAQKEFTRRKETNEIIKVDFCDPELFIYLRETGTKLHKICNGEFDQLSRYTTGKRMVELADRILVNYQKLSLIKGKDKNRRKELWGKIYTDTSDLSFEMQTAMHVRIVNSGSGAAVCDNLKKALRKIRYYYQKILTE